MSVIQNVHSFKTRTFEYKKKIITRMDFETNIYFSCTNYEIVEVQLDKNSKCSIIEFTIALK